MATGAFTNNCNGSPDVARRPQGLRAAPKMVGIRIEPGIKMFRFNQSDAAVVTGGAIAGGGSSEIGADQV